MTRDELVARLSDVVQRSGVEDSARLVRALEKALPPTGDVMESLHAAIFRMTANEGSEPAAIMVSERAWREYQMLMPNMGAPPDIRAVGELLGIPIQVVTTGVRSGETFLCRVNVRDMNIARASRPDWSSEP